MLAPPLPMSAHRQRLLELAASVADGGRAKVYATFVDGDPGSVTLSWTFYGSPQ